MGGFSKFAVKLCSEMQEKDTVYIAPTYLHICNNDSTTQWLQHELWAQKIRRKIFCYLKFKFLSMHHAVSTVLVASSITF